MRVFDSTISRSLIFLRSGRRAEISPPAHRSGKSLISLLPLHDLFPQMVPTLFQLGVELDDHLDALMTENLSHLGDARTALQQIGSCRVAIKISDQVPAQAQFCSDPAEAAADGVPVPRLAVLIEEQWILGTLLHQSLGQAEHLRRQDDDSGLPGLLVGLVL